jgi:hypothetical protein
VVEERILMSSSQWRARSWKTRLVSISAVPSCRINHLAILLGLSLRREERRGGKVGGERS